MILFNYGSHIKNKTCVQICIHIHAVITNNWNILKLKLDERWSNKVTWKRVKIELEYLNKEVDQVRNEFDIDLSSSNGNTVIICAQQINSTY